MLKGLFHKKKTVTHELFKNSSQNNTNPHVSPCYTDHPLPPNLMCPWETEVSKYALISVTHRARNHVNHFLKLELWLADKIIRINLLKEGAKRAILISAI